VHQRRGAAQVGHQAQAGLPHREGHVLADHPQVGGQGELEAGADRVALHGGDDDRRHLRPHGEGPLEPVERAPRLTRHAARRQHAPVQPRRERRTVAAQQHDADVGG
jgi:hypothetical protein